MAFLRYLIKARATFDQPDILFTLYYFLNAMLNKLPKLFRNFYFLTSFLFIVWMIALDSNNVFTRYELSSKLNRLEDEHEYYQEKIGEVTKDHDELFGDSELLEKFAREKYLMKKDAEDIFIVEESE